MQQRAVVSVISEYDCVGVAWAWAAAEGACLPASVEAEVPRLDCVLGLAMPVYHTHTQPCNEWQGEKKKHPVQLQLKH